MTTSTATEKYKIPSVEIVKMYKGGDIIVLCVGSGEFGTGFAGVVVHTTKSANNFIDSAGRENTLLHVIGGYNPNLSRDFFKEFHGEVTLKS
jgi:hypothetical protein